jgi:hypothetical protein
MRIVGWNREKKRCFQYFPIINLTQKEFPLLLIKGWLSNEEGFFIQTFQTKIKRRVKHHSSLTVFSP